MDWFRELGRRLLMLVRRGSSTPTWTKRCACTASCARRNRSRVVFQRRRPTTPHRRFGNDLLLREESRDMWGWNWLENLLQDIRYGLRQLRRIPGFTTVAVLTLALGIGANTAIFTLVDAVMLKSLPVANPSQLYRLGDNNNRGIEVGTQKGG